MNCGRRSLPILASTALAAAALVLASAGVAAAEQPTAGVSERPERDAELLRFLAKTGTQPASAKPASPQPVAKSAPPATCEAAQQGAGVLATLNQLEQTIAQLRKQQLERWAERGWSAKQAAAAGEPVMLNGSGYNVR